MWKFLAVLVLWQFGNKWAVQHLVVLTRLSTNLTEFRSSMEVSNYLFFHLDKNLLLNLRKALGQNLKNWGRTKGHQTCFTSGWWWDQASVFILNATEGWSDGYDSGPEGQDCYDGKLICYDYYYYYQNIFSKKMVKFTCQDADIWGESLLLH